MISDNHFVRVPRDVDVVNVSRKTAKSGERPAFFPVHVDSYGRRMTRDESTNTNNVDGGHTFEELWQPSERGNIGQIPATII